MGVYVTGSSALRISGTGSTRVNNFGNIVTNGLVLMYDAAKTTSYPKVGNTWFDCTCNGINATLVNGNSLNTGRFFNNAFGGYLTTNSQGYGYTNTTRPYNAVNATGSYFISFNSAQSLYFGSQSFTVEYWFRKYRSTGGFDWSGSGTDPNLGGIDNPFQLNDEWGPNKWNSAGFEWCLFIGNGEPTRPLHNPGRGDNFSFWLYATASVAGGWSAGLYRTRQYEAMGPSALKLNTWYQLVGIRDGSILKLYLNGTNIENIDLSKSLTSETGLTGFTSSTPIFNSSQNLRINNTAANNWFTKSDNAILRLYNRALTDTEVQRNFDACKDRYGISKYTIASDGIYVTNSLVLNLDAGNTQSYSGFGFTWSDISGNSNNVRSRYRDQTGFNDPLLPNNTNFMQYFPPCPNFHRGTFRHYWTVSGGFNAGGLFENLSPSSMNFGTSSFTVEYWFRKLVTTSNNAQNRWGVGRWYPGALNLSQFILGLGRTDIAFPGAAATYSGDFVSFRVAVGNASYGTTPNAISIGLDTWYQLIGIREGNQLRTYLNGVKTQEETPQPFNANGTPVSGGATFSATFSVNSQGTLKIAATDQSDLYTTNVDSSIVRIYNKALSDAEVLQNWNAHKSRFGY